VRLAEAAADE